MAFYLTTKVVTGIWHLEGQTVSILADGAPLPPQVVVNGSISIPYQASVIHVGLSYVGLIRTMALTPQSQAGSTTAKKKTVNRLGVKFLNTLGAKYGTNLYNMKSVPFGQPSDLMGRTSPPYSGVKVVPLEDSTDEDKHIYIQQILPLPCIVEAIVPFADTDDE